MHRAPQFVLTALLAVASILAPLASGAQTFSATASTISPLPPLPPIQGCAFSVIAACQTLQQQILVYNSYASTFNQVLQIQQQEQHFLLYPQSVPNTTASDLTQIQNLVTKTENVSWLSQNTDQQIAKSWPSFQSTLDPASVDAQMSTLFTNGMTGALQTSGLLEQQNERDASLVQQIQSAGANAKSPTQLANLEIQLLSVMNQALIRLTRLESEKMNAEVTSDIVAQGTKHAEQLRAEEQLQTQLNALNPSILRVAPASTP